jgi:hypothetical protein
MVSRVGEIPNAPNPARDLLQSASRLARSGYAAFAAGDAHLFVLHSATAVEHLVKAALAAAHPVLIADLRSEPSVVHLLGLKAIPENQVRTVSCREAFARARRTLRLRTADPSLIDLRDALVHFGHTPDASVVEEALAGYLVVTDDLLRLLDRSDEDYWVQAVDAVRARLSSSHDAVLRFVQDLLVDARGRGRALEASLDPATVQLMVGSQLDRPEEQLVECPACGFEAAIVAGDLEEEAHADDYDDEGSVSSVYWSVTMTPTALRCVVCRLELHGVDQLRAAGLGDIELDEDDAQAYVEMGFEPDYDSNDD